MEFVTFTLYTENIEPPVYTVDVELDFDPLKLQLSITVFSPQFAIPPALRIAVLSINSQFRIFVFGVSVAINMAPPSLLAVLFINLEFLITALEPELYTNIAPPLWKLAVFPAAILSLNVQLSMTTLGL